MEPGISQADEAPPTPTLRDESPKKGRLADSCATRTEQRGNEKAASETEEHQSRNPCELPFAAAQSRGCLEVHVPAASANPA